MISVPPRIIWEKIVILLAFSFESSAFPKIMKPIASRITIENLAFSFIQTHEYNVKSQLVKVVCFANTSKSVISYHQNTILDI